MSPILRRLLRLARMLLPSPVQATARPRLKQRAVRHLPLTLKLSKREAEAVMRQSPLPLLAAPVPLDAPILLPSFILLPLPADIAIAVGRTMLLRATVGLKTGVGGASCAVATATKTALVEVAWPINGCLLRLTMVTSLLYGSAPLKARSVMPDIGKG